MILADKITNLRKKNGWSQEELADKMRVSRQAVSKWESAQTMPDLEKILALSELFGVTTDYLLKDEIENEEFTESADVAPVKRVSLALANEFLEWRKRAAKGIATATFLCIVAAIPLLILSAASQTPVSPVSENLAVGAGLAALIVIVAPAVAIFVLCGLKNAPYRFLDGEPFETEYGVEGMVREKEKAFRASYVKSNVAAACLCVLSPIPLFAGVVTGKEFFTVIMLTVTMFLAGVGAVLFVLVGVRRASMQKLLKEGGYARRDKGGNRTKAAVSTVFWLVVTAVYLVWSFVTDDWDITWVVWPVAGILFAAAMRLFDLFTDGGTHR